jgi:NitT/TauT family transport system ATP-binding protein
VAQHRKNIELPFEVAGRKVDRGYVDELIDLVGLRDFADAKPAQLSGGMRQRASIARPRPEAVGAAAGRTVRRARRHDPAEPQPRAAAHLDREARDDAAGDHGISEAIFLADRVAVMSPRPGRVKEIIEVDLPRPRTPEMMRTPEFHALVDRASELLFGHDGRAEAEA